MIRQIIGASLFLAQLAQHFLFSVRVRNVSLASTSHGRLFNYVVREYIFLGLILYYRRMSHSQTAAMSFQGSLRFSFETTRGEEWRRIRIYVRQMIYTRGFFFPWGIKEPLN